MLENAVDHREPKLETEKREETYFFRIEKKRVKVKNIYIILMI
jgi:hypothetical protein